MPKSRKPNSKWFKCTETYQFTSQEKTGIGEDSGEANPEIQRHQWSRFIHSLCSSAQNVSFIPQAPAGEPSEDCPSFSLAQWREFLCLQNQTQIPCHLPNNATWAHAPNRGMPYAEWPGHGSQSHPWQEPHHHDALRAGMAAQAEIDLTKARDQLPRALKFKSVHQICTKWSIWPVRGKKKIP